jgi:hypothetical protein
MATWSKEFLLQFIEEFHGYPCLWKVKSKEYHNREMKYSAYSALHCICKQFINGRHVLTT